jgi:acetyltransferase-like isoleucine patch superfamily enzyme
VNRFKDLRIIINGEPYIGKNVYIGEFSEVNAKGSSVQIGDNCDIASFVSINVADSHCMCIGLKDDVERNEIYLGENVFVGSHSFIGRGTYIGHHSVLAAGTIISLKVVPPYSLVYGNPAKIKKGYYAKKKHSNT